MQLNTELQCVMRAASEQTEYYKAERKKSGFVELDYPHASMYEERKTSKKFFKIIFHVVHILAFFVQYLYSSNIFKKLEFLFRLVSNLITILLLV